VVGEESGAHFGNFMTDLFVRLSTGIGVLGRTRTFPDSVSGETVHIHNYSSIYLSWYLFAIRADMHFSTLMTMVH
jgi:hypothetical protein